MGSLAGLHRVKVTYEDGHSEILAYETQRSALLMLDAMDGLVGQEGPCGIVAAVEYVNIVPGQPRSEQTQQTATVEFRRRSMVQLDEALKGMRMLRGNSPGQDDEDEQKSA